MTVVNPKSISGINSITTGSGSDNLLTIHTSDANNTERVRVNSSGDVIVGSGVTLSPDGDAFFTGVTTATTFVGALTGNVTGNISGGTVAGSTGTFTGNVAVSGANITLQDSTGSTDDQLQFGAGSDLRIFHNGTNNYIDVAGDGYLYVRPKTNYYLQNYTSGEVYISGIADGAVNIYYNGSKKLETTSDGIKIPDGMLEIVSTSCNIDLLEDGQTDNNHRLRQNNGNFYLQNLNDARDTVVTAIAVDGGNKNVELYHNGTKQCETAADGLAFPSGKGINFNLTADASGTGVTAGSETLDDYEEGTWTPAYESTNGTFAYHTQTGYYTKVGNKVSVTAYIRTSSVSSTGHNLIKVTGLPFAEGKGQRTPGSVRSSASGFQGTLSNFNFPVTWSVEGSQTFGELQRFVDGGNTDLTTSTMNNASYVYLQCTYHAA